MDARPLVVRSGTAVRATGTVVRTAGGLALWHARGHAPATPAVEHPTDLPGLVLLHSGPHDWSAVLGEPVTVSGTWIGDGIDVASLVGAVVPAGVTPPQEPPHERDAGMGVISLRGAHAAERPLWENGSLLWRVAFTEPDGRTRVRVAAHDPRVVGRALEPVYGTTLEVVPSPWDRRTYAQIDNVWALAERLGLLFALAREMCDDGAVRVTMGLTRITTELAAALDEIPDGPVILDVMVRPGSTEDVGP